MQKYEKKRYEKFSCEKVLVFNDVKNYNPRVINLSFNAIKNMHI